MLLLMKQGNVCERLNATCAKVNATVRSDSSIYFFNSRYGFLYKHSKDGKHYLW